MSHSLTSGPLLAWLLLALRATLVVGSALVGSALLMHWLARVLPPRAKATPAGKSPLEISLSGALCASLLGTPLLLLAGGAIGLWLSLQGDAALEVGWGLIFTHFGLVLLWLPTALVRRSLATRGPVGLFEHQVVELGTAWAIGKGGLGLHLLFVFLSVASQQTAFAYDFVRLSFSGGLFLLVGASLGLAAYVAHRLGDEPSITIALVPDSGFSPSVDSEKGPALWSLSGFWLIALVLVSGFALVPVGPDLCFGAAKVGGPNLELFRGVEVGTRVCSSAHVALQGVDIGAELLMLCALHAVLAAVFLLVLFSPRTVGPTPEQPASRRAVFSAAASVSGGLALVVLCQCFAALAVGVGFRSFDLDALTVAQGVTVWGIFAQPVGAFCFLISTLFGVHLLGKAAEAGGSGQGSPAPPSGEQLTLPIARGGFLLVASLLFVSLYLGGWQLPFLDSTGLVAPLGGATIRLPLSPVSLAVAAVGSFGLKLVFVVSGLLFTLRSLGASVRLPGSSLTERGWLERLFAASTVHLVATLAFTLILPNWDVSGATWLGLFEWLSALLSVGAITLGVDALLNPSSRLGALATTFLGARQR